MTGYRTTMRLAVLAAALAVGACATGGGAKPDADAAKADAGAASDDGPAKGSMGAFVRALGESGKANVVLMHGCEEEPGPAVPRDMKVSTDQLNEIAGFSRMEAPDYQFILPDSEPYKKLALMTLSDTFDPSYRDTRLSITLGGGTPIFTAFALLGHALNKTLVADNVLAETQCGELSLTDVPLRSGLEAIAKSARIVNFEVDSTEEYIFVRSPKNTNPWELLLNGQPLTDAQRVMLDRRVDLYLPAPPGQDGRLVMLHAAEPLRKALGPLSQQLGVTVIAEKDLLAFPVNPVVLRHVRVGTALDLLLRQWLASDFGYEVRGDRIVIRRRVAGEPFRAIAKPTTATTSTR